MTNILLLCTDQQRFDSLKVYGNTFVEMPNLNAFAETATVFKQAYATCPVCTPSRGSIMTGLYPHAHGAVHNNEHLWDSAKTIAEHFKADRDIATGHVGKWHLGDEIYAQRGFDEWYASEDHYDPWFSEKRDRTDRSAYHHWLYERGYKPDVPSGFSRFWCMKLPERDSKPTFIANQAVDFIERHHKEDKPWLLCVNTLEPHHPFMGPFGDLYDPDEIEVPENFLHRSEDQLLQIKLRQAGYDANGFEDFHLQSEKSWRQLAAHYWCLCTQIDKQYGRVLQAVKDSGQWDDTLILFYSDHGEMLGSHVQFGKQVPYEESAHVPLMVKLPGQTEQRCVEQPVSLVDLVPTILDIAGVEAAEALQQELHGRSLKTLCEGGEQEPEDVLVMWPETPNQSVVPDYNTGMAPEEAIKAARSSWYRSVMTPERRKFSEYGYGEIMYHDLNENPGELGNDINQLSKDEVASYRDRIQVKMKAIGDPLISAVIQS